MVKNRNPKGKDRPGQKSEKKHNPFEVHRNRVKHNVVGRKTKDDRGLPGVSRAKAFKKRERTILQEYKLGYKSNSFVDRRIGEHNSHMDPEKKMTLRIAAEKKRQFSRKSMFNLNEDEELTHGGVALNDANLQDRLNVSDDDDDDDMLDANFVKEQHFGGGLFTKRDEGEDGTKDGENKTRSRKEWIDDIIAESKKKKAESRKEKDEQYEAVSKLDSELQSFMKLMASSSGILTEDDKLEAKKNCEFREYDVLVKELGFDRTGKARAVEKLKTPEELAKDERRRLEMLEAERVKRMKGQDTTNKLVPRSADDLDDGFVLDKDDDFHVSYKDGKMLTSVPQGDELAEDDNDEEVDTEVQEEEEEGDNSEVQEEDDASVEAKQDDDDDDDDGVDRHSDILEDSESEEEQEDVPQVRNAAKKVTDPKKMKMMEAAKKEIPYTFEVPQDYEAFWALLENRSPKEVNTIVERMITCNHTSLGASNKEKCDDIFAYLLQSLHVLTDQECESPIVGVSGMMYVDSLMPHIYTLTQLSQPNSAKSLLQVLEEKYEDCAKIKFKRYPLANTFVFLKLCGVLFPASDFIHPVMTPAMTFLTQLAGTSKVTTRREVTAALFTAHLIMEYVAASKRFIPELSNLLNGLLYLAIPEENKQKLPLTPPFKHTGTAAYLLTLQDPVTQFTKSKLKFSGINDNEAEIDDDFRINIIHKVIESLSRLCKCWSELPSIRSIMSPTTQLLGCLRLKKYPSCVKEAVEELQATIQKLPHQGYTLVKAEKRPASIRMYEPAIERMIEGVRKRHGTKEYLEKQKLVHKLKRERKGARREIQRDMAVIAKQKLQDTLYWDAIRKRKLDLITSGLQVQEGEYKKMKKKK